MPIAQAPEGPERKEAARQLLESYYQQILVDGFFHADPHPGNLMWWNDTIYFLDFGMVGEVGPEMREQLMLLLMAFWQEDVALPHRRHADARRARSTARTSTWTRSRREIGELMARVPHREPRRHPARARSCRR